MKKLQLCVLAIIIPVVSIFSSCEKNIFEKEFVPRQFFSIHMTADKEGTVFEADVICSSYEDIKIAFTSPQELSGFSVETNGDSYSINAFGVPDELKSNEIKDTSLLNVLIRSIKLAIFTNHGTFTETENGVTATVTAESVNVDIVFDKEGYITSLKAPDIGFSAEFQNQG